MRSVLQWLLAEDGWDAADVKRTFKAEKTQRGMKLKKPFPLITEYMTVSVSGEGLPIFYRDVYGYDKDLWGRHQTEVRWGDHNFASGAEDKVWMVGAVLENRRPVITSRRPHENDAGGGRNAISTGRWQSVAGSCFASKRFAS